MLTSAPDLPSRSGVRPKTLRPNPHTQVDQQPSDPSLRDRVAGLLFHLDAVHEEPSRISVPGARAAVLEHSAAGGPAEAFLVGREFAHLHPSPDGSLHATLPLEWVDATIRAGWAEPHPVVEMGFAPPTAVMIYAPRNEDELAVVASLIRISYRHARGDGDDQGTEADKQFQPH